MPIPITIFKYKKEENDIITIKQKEKKEMLIVEDIKELEEKIENLDFNGYDYVSIFIKENFSLEEIKYAEKCSQLPQIKIGKIMGREIFLFSGREEDILSYIELRYYELIEIKLNCDKFGKLIEDYKKIFGSKKEKELKKLMEKNVYYLPFLKEMTKRLEIIKELAKQEDNQNGLFHTLLRKIKEEFILAFETYINLASNYFAQIFEMKINKGMRLLSAIMGVLSFLFLLASLNPISNFFQSLRIPKILNFPLIIILSILFFILVYKIQAWFVERK